MGAWALMSLIMVLSLRPTWLERPLGGMDKVYRLHKWAGIGAIVLSLLHYGTQLSKSLLVAWVGRPVKAPRADWWLNTFRHLAEDMGEWAVWFLAAMLVITLWQRFPYHVWRYLHKLLAVVYLVLAFHAVVLVPPEWWVQPAGAFVAVATLAGVLCAVRSLAGRIGGSRRHAAQVVAVQAHPGGVVELECQVQGAWKHQAGQFAFLTLQAGEGHHPFTLVNADAGDGRVRFAIKALGDYTAQLAQRVAVGQSVWVEGPYGRFDFRQDRTPEQVWVAAGIGATPFVAWLESLVADPAQAPVVQLHYCVRHAGEAVFAQRMQQLCAQLPSVTLHVHHSDAAGPVAAEALLASAGPQASVWFCGPQGFGQALRGAMQRLGRRPRSFHQELFQMR
ncbi:reductase [Acidovorax sp. 1608163]|nr:reductase [Acidovorax sp. 1608163]